MQFLKRWEDVNLGEQIFRVFSVLLDCGYVAALRLTRALLWPLSELRHLCRFTTHRSWIDNSTHNLIC